MAKPLQATLQNIEKLVRQRSLNDRELGRLRRMDPKEPEDHKARGRCFSQMNLYDEAAVDYEAAISKNADDPEAYFRLGGALSALGRREDAVKALRVASRLRPDNSVVARALSWELERLGRYDDALEILFQYMRLEPNHPSFIYQQLGRIYGRQGRLKEAFTCYLRCIWFNPPSDESNHTRKKRFGEMMSLRNRAEKMDPEDPRSFLLLGVELHDGDWSHVAVDVLSTAARLQPSVPLYLFIGEIHERYLRLTEAINAYLECREKFVGAAPAAEMVPLYDALVTDLFKCGRSQEVLRYGAEAVSSGAAGPDLLKCYTFTRDTPDQLPDGDPMVRGWTAPYYANTILDVPS